MNILHVASEVTPFSKTGGLGDVVGALPRALVGNGAHGVSAQVVSARYGSIDPGRYGLARRLRKLPVQVGARHFEIEVYEGRLQGSGNVPLYLIEHPLFSDRRGLYGPPDQPGVDYADNGLRFALLSQGALVVAQAFDLRPDVVHAHDWQAALALYYARKVAWGRPRPATVLTIHNLAFLGLLPLDEVHGLGVDAQDLHPEGLEFYGKASLLKGGIVFADRVTTVSPRYASEIQTEAFGCGLDGLLRKLSGKLTGILNGADYERWSPWLDPYTPELYGRPGADGVPDLAGKARCKAELQRELGLSVKPRAPLCATVSRLTQQKGIELLLQVLESEDSWRGDMQYALVGSGAPDYEARLQRLQRRFPGRMALRLGYDEPLAHRLEAGADIYVMPSLFEPCGLNQMYSLRYGTVPVVRAVGGLDDTVVDYDAHSRSGTGFKFTGYEARSLSHALHRALSAYHGDEAAWQGLVRRGMRADYGWGPSSRAYVQVYQQALAARGL